MKNYRTNLLGAALIAALASAGQLHASYSSFFWNGGAGSGNGNWSAGGNWGGTAPSQIAGVTNLLFFSGTAQPTTTNDITALTNSITFNNDGFNVNLGYPGDAINNGGGITNVSGSNFITGGLAVNGNSTGAGYYTVLAGTLNLNTTAVTNAVAGAGGIIHKVGPGTLILSGTNTVVTGTFFVDSATTAAGPVTTDDGVVIVTSSSALAKNGSIFISDSGIAKSTLQLDGSAGNIDLNQPAPTSTRFSFTLRNGFDAAPHIESLAGNNSICGPNAGAGKFQLGAGSSSGTNIIFQVDAGTLTINGTNTTAVSGAKFYFVLRGAGNGIIAGSMYNGASFYNAVGNFYKTNSGTWTIITNQYITGNTIVAGGTLALSGNGSIAKCATINVLSGGLLDVSTVNGGWVLNAGQALQGSGVVTGAVTTVDGSFVQPGGVGAAGTLSFSNSVVLSAATTNTFDLGTSTTPGVANDLITIAGNLNPNGATVVINPLSLLTVPGTYRLINYSGTKTGSFGTLIINGRYLGHLDESVPGQINFVVTGGTGLPGNLVWSGDNNNAAWDVTTTPNWNADTEIFFQNDQVTFNDSSAVNTVNVTANVQPGSITFNTTNAAYTLQGSGEIIGTAALVKNGTNSLTLDITNTSTGNLTINAGKLILGPNNGGGALGKGTNTIASGATLDLNGLDAGNSLVAISGTGVGGNGAIVSSTRNTSACGLHNVTLTGDTLVDTTGSPIHFYAFVNAGGAADNYVKGQGYKLTVQGTNNFILDGFNYSVKPAQNPDLGDIEIRAGSALTAYYYTSLGRSGSNCIVDAGGTLTFFATGTNAASKKLTLAGGSFWNNNNGSNFFNGPVAVPSGSASVSVNSGSSLIVNGTISGAGGLTATNGTGTLALAGVNTYTGPTMVYDSTFLANGSLDAASVVTVNNSGTLGGVGTINGPVTINSGGTLSPGDTNYFDFGTLTINTNLTIAGNLLFKVDISTLHTNDYCVVSGTLTNAGTGTLTILDTNASDVFAAGNSFKLFSKPVANGGALTISPALTLPLGWGNKLAVDGTVQVATLPPVLTAAADGSGNLNLVWDGAYTGWLLQVQTNSLSTGLGTNWVSIPGTDSGTSYSLPIDRSNPSVFIRLAPPAH